MSHPVLSNPIQYPSLPPSLNLKVYAHLSYHSELRYLPPGMQSTHGLHGKSMEGILNLSQRVAGSYRKVSLRHQLFHQTGPIDIQKTKREESGWDRLRRRNIRATRLSPDGKTAITKSISKIMVRSPPPAALPCREQHSIQSRQFGFHGLLGHTSQERVILHWGWKYRDKVRQHHNTAPIQ